MFIGRQTELQLLEKYYQSSCAELFVLYGRRRVGKTELLSRFCRDKQAIYYTASQTTLEDNLSQFIDSSRELSSSLLPEGVGFKTIEQILTYLAETTKGKRLVVVLDEFQYWVGAEPAVPSLVQRFWDLIGKHSSLMLVLCGSYISLMLEHTLAEKSPLYGRRTAQLQLQPFDYRTAALFFPNWCREDKLKAFGVLGGMPAYLSQFDSALSLEENIIEKILSKGAFLSEEADFLLKTELRETRVYASLLKLVAMGNTTLKDLSSKMAMESRVLSSYLATLQSLHQIKRVVSFVERASEKSRKGRYYIQDHFLKFWFEFVAHHLTLIERNRGNLLYQEKIKPHFSTYMGKIFEEISMQYLLSYGEEKQLPIPIRVGQVWGKDYDIDVVAENSDGTFTFGECKWANTDLKSDMLFNTLKGRATQTGLKLEGAHFVLFGLKFSVSPSNLLTYITGQDLLP